MSVDARCYLDWVAEQYGYKVNILEIWEFQAEKSLHL